MAEISANKRVNYANERRLSPARNILAGSIGGIFSYVSSQPLDLIKVQLQVQSKHNPVYKGSMDCFMKIVKTEGFNALYRGMLAPVLFVGPASALSFCTLSLGKRLQLKNPKQEPTLVQYLNAGLFCGCFNSVIYCPVERVKCLLQVQKSSGGPPKYNGTLDCAVKLFKESGLRGVYRGLGPTFAREVPGSGAWYLTYEGLLSLSRTDGKSRDSVGPITVICAGGAAGLAYWGLTFPVDVIKTRLQVTTPAEYRGTRDVIRSVLNTEGPKALYRGYVPALMRAVVLNAALFVGYEFTMKAINWILP